MTGFGFEFMTTRKNNVEVAPPEGVGVARFIIVTAEVEALSQHLSVVLLDPVLQALEPLSRNSCATSDVVVAFTL